MNAPPKPTGQEELCPICKKPKSQHTAEEVLECSRKMTELNKSEDGA